ncbi:MAG TPA: hypothetical protein VE404_06440 [Verrucomicrobiae bacterium]|nr:hypothetical protein [Verrucomicrobiae bacterium]
MAGTTQASRELRTISDTMRMLGNAFRSLGLAIRTDGRAPSLRTRPPLRLTEARRKALKLQGVYMGTMRGLKPRQRAQVKKVRAEKGIRAAIAVAKRMAGS